jgi:hypothetical protein
MPGTNGHDDIAPGTTDNPFGAELPSSWEMEVASNGLRIMALDMGDEDRAAYFRTAYMLDQLAERRRARGR